MILRPFFEVVSTEMVAVTAPQSEEIAALGFGDGNLIVQFHRLPGLYAAPAARSQYEALLHAKRIETVFTPCIAAVVADPQMVDWHQLRPFGRKKR